MTQKDSLADLIYRPGTTQKNHQFGELTVHSLTNTLGVESINVPEHSLFLIESDVVTNDIWQGMREPQREWLRGEVIFLPAGTEVNTSYVSREYSETMIRIPETTLSDVAGCDPVAGRGKFRFTGMPGRQVSNITKAVRDLAVAQSRHQGFDMLIESMTQALATSVLSGLVAADVVKPRPPPSSLAPERKRRVLEYIEANLSNPITLAEIAAVAALSPFHFNRAFRRELGVSPIRYVWRRRALLATKMLRDPTLSLSAVAYACGFSSQSHFTTAFRGATGMTPGNYRASVN